MERKPLDPLAQGVAGFPKADASVQQHDRHFLINLPKCRSVNIQAIEEALLTVLNHSLYLLREQVD
jgi:hypothetical protein